MAVRKGAAPPAMVPPALALVRRLARGPCGRQVEPPDVVDHHPLGGEGRGDGADRLLGHLRPGDRDTGRVALVVAGDDLALQEVVDRVPFGRVLGALFGWDRGDA